MLATERLLLNSWFLEVGIIFFACMSLIFNGLNPAHMTANKQGFPRGELLIKRIIRYNTLLLTRLQLQDHSVHSIDRTRLAAWGEELFAPYSAGHNVADERVTFGQVSREIHFLPFISFLYSKSRKTKV